MAFANLFSRLAAVDEDVGTSDRSDFTCRNETGHGERARKRKPQGEKLGSHKKKRCHVKETTTSCDAFKDQTRPLQQQGSDGERELGGNAKEMINEHSSKARSNSSRCNKNQKHISINNCQAYNDQQKLEEKMETNQQQGKDGRRPGNGGGGPGNRGGGPRNRGGGGYGNRGGGGYGNRGGGGYGNRGGGGYGNRGGGGYGNRGGGGYGNRGGGGNGNRGGGPRNRGGGGNGNRGGGGYGNRGGGGYGNRDGGPRNRGGGPLFRKAEMRSNDAEPEKRFMTQEFKDQNALLVDGRLVCRHFIYGRCLMAENCQLEHAEGFNDLVKQACKFYVLETCTKGERCPYMHKSFPCKFFHRNGYCSKKDDCRFSHGPLNEVTEKLLEEALRRDEALRELAKKAEQDSSVQPANTEESESVEADKDPEILKLPLRPNFYNSTDAEKETSVEQTEDVSSVASDAARPPGPPSAPADQQEPVCYSVQAVLGAQMSRPYISFFGGPRGEDPAPAAAPRGSSDVTVGNTSHAPYSVDAVLKSYKSMGNSTLGQIPTFSSTQSLPYTPKSTSEKVPERVLGSQNQNQKVPVNTREDVNMYQGKIFSPVCADSISRTSPDLSYLSGDRKKRGGEVSARQRPAQRELSRSVVTEAEISRSDESKDAAERRHLPMEPMCSESSAWHPPKHHTQLKPHLSGLTSDSLRKAFSPSSGFKGLSVGAAEAVGPVKSPARTKDPSNAAVHHFGAQFSEMLPKGTTTQPTPKPGSPQGYLSNTSPERQGRNPDGKDSSVKRPFRSLFAPLTPDSETAPARPQCFIKSPQSADIARTKTCATSFHSLFASPLRATPTSPPGLESRSSVAVTRPCSQQSLLRPKHRASGLRAPLSVQAKPGVHSPAPPARIPDPGLDRVKQVATPVSQDPPSDAPTGHPPRQLPDVSPPRDSAAETSTKSVLKGLFLSLGPYQEDGETRESSRSPSDEEKEEKSSSECVLKQQQESRVKKKRKKRKNKMTRAFHQQSAVDAAAGSAEHQSSQTSDIRDAGTSRPQERNSGSRVPPFTPAAPLTQRPTLLRVKQGSEEGEVVNGNTAVTPFKDLFKPF